MTLPDERTRAIYYARIFLLKLTQASKTPKVPLAIRNEARRILKHFPTPYDIETVALAVPGKLDIHTAVYMSEEYYKRG